MATGDDGDKSALSYGLYPAAGVVVGSLIGTWVDHHFGWSALGVITGVVIGVLAGLYLLIKEGMKAGK